jgi:hypothetical protein
MMCKNLFQIIVILLLVTLSGCTGKEQYKQKQLDKLQNYVYQFHLQHKVNYLDSALMVMRQIVEKFPEYKKIAPFKNAEIYYLKKDYEMALSELQNTDAETHFVGFKTIWKNKIKVKIAEKAGDSLEVRSLYKQIYDGYLSAYNEIDQRVKEMLKKQDDNEIYASWVNFLHVEMYHYRRLLTDTETILASIDSLQAATQGNERYFERLKNLFIDDNYEIFLE